MLGGVGLAKVLDMVTGKLTIQSSERQPQHSTARGSDSPFYHVPHAVCPIE